MTVSPTAQAAVQTFRQLPPATSSSAASGPPGLQLQPGGPAGVDRTVVAAVSHQVGHCLQLQPAASGTAAGLCGGAVDFRQSLLQWEHSPA